MSREVGTAAAGGPIIVPDVRGADFVVRVDDDVAESIILVILDVDKITLFSELGT